MMMMVIAKNFAMVLASFWCSLTCSNSKVETAEQRDRAPILQ